VRRVWAELRNRGLPVNRKRVQRLMRLLGLQGRRIKRKYHSYMGTVGKVAGDLIGRDFAASGPDRKWATDVSEFAMAWGKCYLSPIKDMFTNEIIAWDLSVNPNFEQTRRMLEEAFRKHPGVKGLVFHSDQGWQYQMRQYGRMLSDHGVSQSMSRKGNCLDNSIMEAFFATMKVEMFYGHEPDFKTFEQFREAVAEYIRWYNSGRIQSKTKWMPPLRFREASICAV
jgi:Transposase and inactivated derivatives